MAEQTMQGSPQQGGFPANNEEAEQFILQTVKVINSDDELVRILQEKTGGAAPISAIVGAICAQILTLLFTKLYKETGGQLVDRAFVVQIIRAAVKEISDISDGLGKNTTVDDEKQAAKVAGDALDSTMKQLYSGGGQQVPQGMMQGPQQAPQEVAQGGIQ
jgi:hypothetical protein